MNIGDIVKFENKPNLLFMVTDIADFSESTNIEDDIDLELMQIYPMSRISTYSIVGMDEVYIHARKDSKECKSILKLIEKDRERKGWYGTPDYIKASETNLKEEEVYKAKIQPPKQSLDTIRYNSIGTIDECLDAYNHLTALHENFGDDTYLELRKEVEERMITLTK